MLDNSDAIFSILGLNGFTVVVVVVAVVLVFDLVLATFDPIINHYENNASDILILMV